jgi:hypothetical protein
MTNGSLAEEQAGWWRFLFVVRQVDRSRLTGWP